MSSLGDVVEHYVLLSALIFTIGGIGFLVRSREPMVAVQQAA